MTEHNPPEIWAPVVGYEGRYEVSSFGNVRSIARACLVGYGAKRNLRPRILRATPDTKGYRSVSLSKDGKVSTKRICSLVAEAFLGPKPEGTILAHGLQGKSCDELTNLAYKQKICSD